jgi:dipeptidyl aminopeptidase/acylaminoacyl peptidase
MTVPGGRSRSSRFGRWPVFAVVFALGAMSCTGGTPERVAVTPTAQPSGATASSAHSPTRAPAAGPPHPVSLQALMQESFNGHDFQVGRVLARNSAYTRSFITYESGGFTISGIMNVPAGRGPFPLLILNHGHHDLEVYTNGRGLRREQDYLARRGYVVVHPDFRNHAQSDNDPRNELNLRLGYTEDVVNAVLAIRKANLPYVNRERVGMLGRSMGGGISLNAAVVAPHLVDAVVLFAPVSSDYTDNFNRWTRSQDERRQLADRIVAEYGSPEDNPAFWRNISAINFLGRVAVPIQVHHGTADERVPIAWTQRTVRELTALGKSVELLTYAGEHHEFGPQFTLSMRRTVAFFDAQLKR